MNATSAGPQLLGAQTDPTSLGPSLSNTGPASTSAGSSVDIDALREPEDDDHEASAVHRTRRRRCKCFPAAAAAPPAPKVCLTCHAYDLTTPVRTDSYADGHIQVLGQPIANDKMLQFLADLEKTSTGKRIIEQIKTLGTAGPVQVVHVDLATWCTYKKVPIPDSADRKLQEFMDFMIRDLAWTARDTNNQGVAVKWTQDILRATGDITPGPHSRSGDIVIAWEASLLEQYLHVPMNENPGSVWIGHELIHAIHYMCGEVLTGYKALDALNPAGDNEEEMRTIGAYGFSYEELSENRIRDELGLARRYTHAGFLENGKNVRVGTGMSATEQRWINQPD